MTGHPLILMLMMISSQLDTSTVTGAINDMGEFDLKIVFQPKNRFKFGLN